jgi:uncharacterized membrane-anchored protein YhcB (DUF1043 family)
MSENTHTANDVSVMLVVGLIVGIFIGFLAGAVVIDHNVSYHETEYRKQMVELGVGYYDSRTGGFNTRACTR